MCGKFTPYIIIGIVLVLIIVIVVVVVVVTSPPAAAAAAPDAAAAAAPARRLWSQLAEVMENVRRSSGLLKGLEGGREL